MAGRLPTLKLEINHTDSGENEMLPGARRTFGWKKRRYRVSAACKDGMGWMESV